jgi:dipeptidyl aminopeptidase/acylaminoacyl peptidase
MPADDQTYADVRPTGLAFVPLVGGRSTQISIEDRWQYQGIVKADARTVWQPEGSSATLLLQEQATGELAIVRYGFRSGDPQILWKGLARIGNLVAGGRHDAVFGIYQDVTTPPNVYRFSDDFSEDTRISHIEPRLDTVAVGTAEVFETTVPLHNGELDRVRTAVLLPPGAKRGDRLPAIANIYPGSDLTRQAAEFGGGNTATVPSLVFTSRGYAVLLAHIKLGPNREAGNPIQQMVDVLLPQVYRAAELGYIDIERVAITGQSYGGYGTGSIVSATNIFRAAVAVSGIYDLAGTYGYLEDDGGSFYVGWAEGGQARMGTHPWANLRRYTENSPYYRADKIFTPLLILHGDADNAYHDAMKLFSALRRLDRPVEFATYHGQGHVVYEWTPPNAIDATRRMVTFYRRQLGDPANSVGN